jgi:hypothetical protein
VLSVVRPDLDESDRFRVKEPIMACSGPPCPGEVAVSVAANPSDSTGRSILIHPLLWTNVGPELPTCKPMYSM